MAFSVRLQQRGMLLLLVILSLFQVPSWSFAFQRSYQVKKTTAIRRTITASETRRRIELGRLQKNLKQQQQESVLPSARTATSILLATSCAPFPPSCSPLSSISAVCGLVGSSMVGILVDRFLSPIIRSSGTGILATLTFAAILSNLQLVPLTHPMYDTCWTLFLPASLSLLLLANRNGSKNNNNNEGTLQVVNNKNNKEERSKSVSTSSSSSTKTIIQRVSIPFVIGSIGSILGCIVSFFLSTPATGTTRILRSTRLSSTLDAAMAAGCLCATFIGGSVNFFSTHRVLLQSTTIRQQQQQQHFTSSSSSSLMAAMSTAELIVMALYFAWLSIATESKTLRSAFGTTSKNQQTGHPRNDQQKDDPSPSTDKTWTETNDDNDSFGESASCTRNFMVQQGVESFQSLILVGGLAYTIVQIAAYIEGYLSNFIPGTGCAMIALLSVWTNKYLSHISTTQSTKDTSSSSATPTKKKNSIGTIVSTKVWKQMQQIASPMSDFCFYLLFASIGMSANLGQALKNGPSCLVFSTIALAVHIATTLIGSIGIQRILPNQFRLQLEDVLVASNAAIGGPATAASFAGRLKLPNTEKQQQKQGLIMAATTWGIVGYALATSIGVALTHILLKWS